MTFLPCLILALTGWVWPLPGSPQVTRGFDPPLTRFGSGHRGVDLAAAVGSPVLAAGAGVVTFAGTLAGRGVVVVRHGPLRTTYEPVRAAVRVGERVSAGQLLGRLSSGHPGCRAPACLHWGLRRGTAYLDPLDLVGRGAVRLLPIGSAPVAPGWARAGPPARVSTGQRRTQPALNRVGPADSPTGEASAAGVLAESALAVGVGVAVLRRTRRPS